MSVTRYISESLRNKTFISSSKTSVCDKAQDSVHKTSRDRNKLCFILTTWAASLTPSCSGHLSLSTTPALPILKIFQFMMKQAWAFSSSVHNCFQLSTAIIDFVLCRWLAGVEACLQAGKWLPEAEHEAGDGPLRSRINRCSLVNKTN